MSKYLVLNNEESNHAFPVGTIVTDAPTTCVQWQAFNVLGKAFGADQDERFARSIPVQDADGVVQIVTTKELQAQAD